MVQHSTPSCPPSSSPSSETLGSTAPSVTHILHPDSEHQRSPGPVCSALSCTPCFTHDCCVATHSSNTIIKFADNISLITGDNEIGYREVRGQSPDILVQNNNLHLNVSKTKELIVDFRKRQREQHAPLSINGGESQQLQSSHQRGQAA
ncbi:hypothetical protein L3Q82_010418 [Scortum barcoo]|uniref:Uncharacterized protein n=1 Tax=Scortum barcoo TaxID=214431 RepID=A0ACB8WF40_9TELE|nr:hypothetical protein L3Q82_010418 [Scortum barcoo]